MQAFLARGTLDGDIILSNRLSRRASRISRLIATGALLLAANTGHAALIGQWTFEGSGNAALVDSTGNFGDLQLHGDASIANGKLTVSGSGTTVSGWAGTSGYTGATITDKTLAVWVTLGRSPRARVIAGPDIQSRVKGSSY